MSKFVLIVDLEVKPESVDMFVDAAVMQVEETIRTEPGCHRFDIVRSADDRTKFTHYEIFEDAGAFEAHTTMPHTVAFKEKVEPMILNMQMRSGNLLVGLTK